MKTSRITEHRFIAANGTPCQWHSTEDTLHMATDPGNPLDGWTIQTRTITTEEQELPASEWLQMHQQG